MQLKFEKRYIINIVLVDFAVQNWKSKSKFECLMAG